MDHFGLSPVSLTLVFTALSIWRIGPHFPFHFQVHVVISLIQLHSFSHTYKGTTKIFLCLYFIAAIAASQGVVTLIGLEFFMMHKSFFFIFVKLQQEVDFQCLFLVKKRAFRHRLKFKNSLQIFCEHSANMIQDHKLDMQQISCYHSVVRLVFSLFYA